VGTWAAAPAPAESFAGFNNQTIRLTARQYRRRTARAVRLKRHPASRRQGVPLQGAIADQGYPDDRGVIPLDRSRYRRESWRSVQPRARRGWTVAVGIGAAPYSAWVAFHRWCR
jgi:hypothetical protein